MVTRTARRLVTCLLLLVASTNVAGAQDLHGAVRDSASKRLLAGAVVLVLDAQGTVLQRGLTSENGIYRVTLAPSAAQIELRRIGFRPRTVAIPHGRATLDVAMMPIATMLEPMRVADKSSCSRRRDRPAALGLWEQARAALLASVVARDVAPASMVRLRFDRSMDAARIASQRVLIDSVGVSSTPFVAARSSVDFVKSGFLELKPSGATFFGPDADVLLDDAFALGYCFHLANADKNRPNQIGLGLAPAQRRAGRVDIEGTLWVDTAARALRDVSFRYVSRDHAVEAGEPGGRIAFRELANGLVIIDQWSLRLIDPRADTTFDRTGRMRIRPWIDVRDIGGEVAHARWPDGFAWHASLGTLKLHAEPRDSGPPAWGTLLRLKDTDYRGVIDSTGTLVIPDLLPGPYTVEVVDPMLARIGVAIPTSLTFVASRDSTIETTLRVPTAGEHIANRCVASTKRLGAPLAGTAWLLGRVVAPDGMKLEGTKWAIDLHHDGTVSRVIDAPLDADGIFAYCKSLPIGADIEMRILRDDLEPVTVRLTLEDHLTVMRIPVKSR